MFTVRNMKSILLGLLFAACSLPLSAEPEKSATMSESMSLIVKHHLVGKHDLNVKDMPTVADFKEPAADADHEIYRLPADPQMADGFNYSVILDKKLQQYWIVQSGGFAGRTTVYGPVALATLKEK
jgi:hypothetical protein